MPNSIKYNVSAETLALKKGNFWIGTGDVGKGPTSSTGYYNGITPPSGGYTIYLNKATGGPSIYTVNTEAQLTGLTSTIAGQSLTTSGACLNWFATQTDKMIFNIDYPVIVTNGLVLNVDAGFTPSYSQSGTTWYDVSSSGNNGTLTNGPTFNSNNGGSIVLDGIDDYISLSSSVLFGGSDRTFTLMMWVYGQPNPNAFSGFLRINGTLLFYSPSSATVGSNAGSYRLGYPYPSTSYMSISLPINSWYLLTLTNLDSQTPSYQGYSLNGEALTTTTYTGRIEPYEIRIGMADGYINGKVGNVIAYNRVLSNDEIKQNYNAIIQRYNLYANPLTVFKSNLTLWLDTSLPTATSNTANYNTIDTTGTVSFSRIYDMSGNGSHASQINKNRQPTLGTTSNSKNISISDGTKGFALSNISDGLRTIYIVHKNSSLSVGRGGASNGFVIQGTSFYGYSSQFNFAPYDNQVRCNLPSPAANNRLQITILVSFSDRTEGYTTTNNGVITSPTTVMKNNYYLGNNTLNYLTNSGSYYQVGMFCRNLGGDSNIDSFEAGEFAEIIVVNRISTADEIATTQNYLYNKWFN